MRQLLRNMYKLVSKYIVHKIDFCINRVKTSKADQKIQGQLKIIEHMAVYVLNKAYSTIPLSGHSNVVRRSLLCKNSPSKYELLAKTVK